MDRRFVFVSLCLATAACAHSPHRAVRAAKVSLGSVDVLVPDEPGWTVSDREGPVNRVVRLEHVTPAGEVDRRVSVTDRFVLARDWTPETFLARAQRATPLHEGDLDGAFVESEPFRADEGFGPLAVRRSMTAASRPRASVGATRVTELVFLPAGQAPNQLVVAWESSSDGTTPILDGLRPADASSAGGKPREPSDPDLLGEVTVGFTTGAAAVRVKGQDFVPEMARLSLDVAGRLPRSPLGVGFGVDVGVGVFSTVRTSGSDDLSAWLAEANAFLIFRGLRLGVGLGRDSIWKGTAGGQPIDAVTVIAPRGFVTLDLGRAAGIGAVSVGVEGMEQGGYKRVTAFLSGRFCVPQAFSSRRLSGASPKTPPSGTTP